MEYLQMEGENEHLHRRSLVAMMNGQFKEEDQKHLNRCSECLAELVRLKNEQAKAAQAVEKYAV